MSGNNIPSPQPKPQPSTISASANAKRRAVLTTVVPVGVVLLLLVLVGWWRISTTSQPETIDPSLVQPVNQISLERLLNLSDPDLQINEQNKLLVNGELTANDALVITPGEEPTNPKSGQLYYDGSDREFRYFDGEEFVTVNSNINEDEVCFIGADCGFLTASDIPETTLPQPLDVVDTPTFLNLNLTQNLRVQDGGTGRSSFINNAVLLGNGTAGIASTNAPTPGQVLVANSSGTPRFVNINGDATVNSSGSLSLSANTVNAAELASTGVAAGVYGNGSEYPVVTVDEDGRITAVSTQSLGAGGSVTSLNSLAGALNIQGTVGEISVSDNGTDTITLSLGANVTQLGSTIELGTETTGTYDATPDTIADDGVIDDSEVSDAITISASGNVADGALSANVTLQGNTFNGANQLVQLNGSSQLPAVSGALLTNLNASNISSGTLADARLSANVTLLGNSIQDGEVDDNLTVSAAGSVADGALSANVSLLGATIELGTETTGTYDSTPDTIGDDNTIVSSEINDGTITEPDLSITNGEVGGYVLSSDGAGGFTWVQDNTGTDTTYTAGNDLDLSGTTFNLESQLDFVNTIAQDSSNLTLQTTTSGNIALNAAGTIELQSNSNVTGTLTASGLTTLNGGLTIEAGDTLTFNGDAFTDLTGNGLQETGNALTLNLQANKGLEVDGSGLSLVDCGLNEILKYNGSNQWACATDGGGDGVGVTTIGAIDTQTKSANGAVISGSDIFFQTADASNPGLVSTTAQTFAGNKTFQDNVIVQGNTTLGNAAGDSLTVNATSTFNEDITVAANKSLTLTGGTTANRPASPSEGEIFFDTDTDTLLTYANGKWQADRGEYVIVAANDSSQKAKDAADYVADGTSDEDTIQDALDDADPGTDLAGVTDTDSSKVLLLAGTYIVDHAGDSDATIFVPNNMTLAGVGKDTIIELADIDADENIIENSDTVSGTGVTIRDLSLDGRSDLNTTGSQTGVYFDNMGGGSGATARQGSVIANVNVSNFSEYGFYLASSSEYNTLSNNIARSTNTGFYLFSNSNYNTLTGNIAQDNDGGFLIESSIGNILSGNVSQDNVFDGFTIRSSTSNTLSGNISQDNGFSGLAMGVNSDNNTITGNTFKSNVEGVSISSGNDNSVTGNTFSENSGYGLEISSNNNTVISNTLHDNGGSTNNNAIYLSGADSNTITGNAITDTSATTTNYAINISDAASDANYLADNNLGTGSINDSGTNTIYAGQVDSSGNYDIQPAGDVQITANTDITGTLGVTGVATFDGNLTVGDTAGDTLTINAGSLQLVNNFNSCTALNTDASGNVGCDTSTYLTSSSAFIQNGNSFGATAVLGTNDVNSLILETNNTTALTIDTSQNATFAANLAVTGTSTFTGTLTTNGNTVLGDAAGDTLTVNATSTYNEDITVAADKSLTLTGGTTANRPSSPSEGEIFYDTDTDTLLTYANGKWQADRGEYTIVAASDSSQAEQDSADYVANGTDDEDTINTALTAASGGKVLLLAGTYQVDINSSAAGNGIEIPNNTTLAGVGPGTVIELQDIDVNINVITNSDQTTGTGVVIRDLSIDGQDDLNTVGFQYGIYFNNMGGGSGAGTRIGANISNLSVFDFSPTGINIENSANNTIINNSVIGSGYGVALTASSDNLITNNNVQVDGSFGIRIDSGSDNVTVSGNTVKEALLGLFVQNSDNIIVTDNVFLTSGYGVVTNGTLNTNISGNFIEGITNYGVELGTALNSNVSSNIINNSGGSTNNNAIYIFNADSNTIIGNIITDSSATTTNYPINIDSNSDANYLANNTLGTGSINDAGTGTIYAGQVDSSGNYDLQPAGDVQITANTDITGTLGVTGAATFDGTVTVGDAAGDSLTVNAGSIQFANNFTSCTAINTDVSGNLGCDTSTYLTSSSAFIQNGNSFGATAVLGTNDTNSLILETNDTTALTIDTSQNATFAGNISVTGTSTFTDTLTTNGNTVLGDAAGDSLTVNATSTFNEDITVAADKSLTLTGGTTANRPSSPSEGEIFYDTDTDTLLTYANGKWQADRGEYTIVAADDSTQAQKDVADYLVTSAQETAGNADVAIQAAIDSLPASGGAVLLMPGTYTIDNDIVLPSFVTFAGSGEEQTAILLENSLGSGVDVITNADYAGGNSGILIRDITLDGNKLNQTLPNGFRGLYFDGDPGVEDYITIDNITIQNFNSRAVQIYQMHGAIEIIDSKILNNDSYGMWLDWLGQTNIVNNEVDGNGNTGIYFRNGEGGVSITGNKVSNNVGGILGRYLFDSLISNNVVINNTYGIGTGTDAWGVIVSDNVVSNNSSDGISLGPNSAANVVDSNFIYGSGGSGVDMSNTSDDNTIKNNHISGFGDSGIKLDGWTNYATNNFIRSWAADVGHGIFVDGGSVIRGNEIFGDPTASEDGIHIAATSGSDSNIISDNVINYGDNSTSYDINISDSAVTGVSLAGNIREDGSTIYINDAGTNTIYANQTDANGNFILSGTNGVGIGVTAPTTSLQNAGAYLGSQIAAPAAPTVTNQGTAGSTSYGYTITALDGLGETVGSTEGTTATGNATLDGTNFNRITWDRVRGAVSYNVYRTTAAGTPSTTGLIGTVNSGATAMQLDDTGLAASTAAPTTNTTGGGQFEGNLVVDGSTTLGDTSTDTITFNGQVNTDILPSVDDTYSLGSSTNRWADLYLGPNSLNIGTDGDNAVLSYTVNDMLGFNTGLDINNVIGNALQVKQDVATSPSTFAKAWGGTGFDGAGNLVQTSDGGYAVAGYTASYGAGSNDQTLVKYNSSGVEQWSKTWGSTGDDRANALVQTTDGGFAVAGYTLSYGAGSFDQSLVKYDSAGTEQWSKTWGGTGVDSARALVQTADGGFAVAGITQSYGAGSYDQTLVKYDSLGTEQWSKTWGGTDLDHANALVQTSDGGFAVAGHTSSYGAGGTDQTLVKYDSNGVEQWSKTWGGISSDYANALVQTSDGGFAVAGDTASYGAGDQTLVKYNSSGVEQWSKTWGGGVYDVARALLQTSDGGFAVAGSTQSYGAGNDDQTLVKYDASGLEQWSKTWGGTGADNAGALVQTSDGGFAVAGETQSYGAGSSDQTLVKYDANGDIAGCGGICSDVTITEGDVTITEADETVTEGDVTITEADETVTEADQTDASTETDIVALTAGTTSTVNALTVDYQAQTNIDKLSVTNNATFNGGLNVSGLDQSTADTDASEAFTVVAGQGGVASATAGGIGGAISLTGGQGGDGTVALSGGDGGDITLQGGAAGTDNGGGTGNYGNLIFNPSGGLVGIGNTAPDTDLEVTGGLCVSDAAGDDCTTAAGTIRADGSITANAFDLAELYASNEDTAPGTLVSIDAANPGYVKTAEAGDQIIGIVSSDPGLLLGWEDNEEFTDAPHVVEVALVGRVPVLVNKQNGEIANGDPITISNQTGEGMKATEAARIVGYALEPLTTSSGTITVLIQNEFWMPSLQQQASSSLQSDQNAQFSSINVSGNTELNGELVVKGNATFNQDVLVEGKLTVKTAIEVTGDINLSGRLISKAPPLSIIALESLGFTQDEVVPIAEIDGTRTAGTVTLTTGVDPGTGKIAEVIFDEIYDDNAIPRIVLTPIGANSVDITLYVVKTPNGFKLGTKDTLQSDVTYEFDYIIIESEAVTTENNESG